MRIGIFGGSYNPPHKMHYDIANLLIENNYLDKVIFVPTGSKYKYKSNLLDDNHRLKMLEIMTKENSNMEISDYELKDYVVYTCETLKYFKDIYSDDEIYFVCGADNLSYIDEWKNGLDILSNYKILVIKRDTDDIDLLLKKYEKYKSNIIVSDINPRSVSSTSIRELLKNNLDTSNYLDSEVIKYIKENNLYM